MTRRVGGNKKRERNIRRRSTPQKSESFFKSCGAPKIIVSKSLAKKSLLWARAFSLTFLPLTEIFLTSNSSYFFFHFYYYNRMSFYLQFKFIYYFFKSFFFTLILQIRKLFLVLQIKQILSSISLRNCWVHILRFVSH